MVMEIKTPVILGDLSFRLGGMVMPIASLTTTPVTIANTAWGLFKCGINNTAQAVTLPASASATGKLFLFKISISIGTGTVTLTPATGTIDGAGTYVLDAQYEAVIIICDGTNWHVLGKITV